MRILQAVPIALALLGVQALHSPTNPVPHPGTYQLTATYRMGDQAFEEDGWLEVEQTLGGRWLELRQVDERDGQARARWFLSRGDGETTYHLVQMDEHSDGPLLLEGAAESDRRLRFQGTEVFPWSRSPVDFDLTIESSAESLAISMTSRESTSPFFSWDARRTPASSTSTPSEPMQADDCATRFNDLFGRIFHRFHRVDSPRSSPPSPEMLSALHHLRDTGPLTVGEACGHFHRSQSSVSELFNRLEARRLIVRYPDERDRRRTLTWLSEIGLTTLDEHATVLSADRLASALVHLSAERRTQLIEILDELATTDHRNSRGEER